MSVRSVRFGNRVGRGGRRGAGGGGGGGDPLPHWKSSVPAMSSIPPTNYLNRIEFIF
jgi:hypothetical protein